MWNEWVLDATMGIHNGVACFVPIEKDGTLVTGMNMVGYCPGKLVGVWHRDGPAAVELWIFAHPDWRKYGNVGAGVEPSASAAMTAGTKLIDEL